MLNEQEFYEWERTSRDTIDLKRCYIDIAGDLVSGLLLSQIIYWFLPGEHGLKLRVEKEDKLWLAKGRVEWWDECRITPKQFDRAIQILKDGNLVETKRFRFKGSPTIHIWLNIQTLLERVNSNLTKGEKPNQPKGNPDDIPEGELEVDETVKSLTETTPKTKAKTTSDMLYFGEFVNVVLSVPEYKKLVDKFELDGANTLIQALSIGIKSKGYKYKSHYATILNWDRMDNARKAPVPENESEQNGRGEITLTDAPKISEVINRPEYSNEDIQYLDGFCIEYHSLFRIAQCLRGEVEVARGTRDKWRNELLRMGIKVVTTGAQELEEL